MAEAGSMRISQMTFNADLGLQSKIDVLKINFYCKVYRKKWIVVFFQHLDPRLYRLIANFRMLGS
ncbi:hypothetical protein KIH39_09070 [Telmatocola sphagniphila]|uniref:Uncharacterized protein n=1 Tax=Telmatocola sphagniphila TaxID=1123043 RepID=A0A8E6EUS4_9BACT|nr:hypothetical protein [Telmatocola sphagniphila]QVL34039.1 hypothetical protein KIH39_09070 [Telmatocola sphagniphila]